LVACARPTLRSFLTSCYCSLRYPSRSTIAFAVDDLGGVGLVGTSKEAAARRPLPIVFLWFWLGIMDVLLPASALSLRRHLKNHNLVSRRERVPFSCPLSTSNKKVAKARRTIFALSRKQGKSFFI
jgi:hypothetical protein